MGQPPPPSPYQQPPPYQPPGYQDPGYQAPGYQAAGYPPPYGSTPAPGYPGAPPPDQPYPGPYGNPYGAAPGQPTAPSPYGYPPPAGWPTAVPAPPAGGGNRTAGIVIAVIAAVVVLIGGATLVAYGLGAFGRDGGPLARNDPEQVVREFVAAYRQGDCTRLFDLSTDAIWRDEYDSRREAIQDCEDGFSVFTGGFNVRVEGTRTVFREGNRAEVEADLRIGNSERETSTFFLHRESGRWLVDEVD